MQYKSYGLLISVGILLNFLVGCSAAEGLISTINVASEFGGRQVHGEVLVLPIGDGEPDHLLIVNQQLSPSASELWEDPNAAANHTMPIFVSYLQPNGEIWEILWEQNLGDVTVTDISLFQSNTLVFAVVEDTVWAWDMVDGALQWQLSLQDVVTRTCDNCIHMSNEGLFILTQDRYLYAIDTQAGEMIWEARLNAQHGFDALTVIEGHVVVLDRADEDTSTPMGYSWYQIADGTLARHVAPTCADGSWARGVRTTDQPMFNATHNEALFVVDGGSGDTCLLHVSLADGTLLQEIRVPKEVLPQPSPAQRGDPNYIWDGQMLYTANRDGELLLFDMEAQTSEVLTAVTDTTLTLQYIQEGVLLVRAQRTRGAEQDGLWGINPQTGETLWQHDVQNSELFGVDSIWSGDWTWRLDGQTLTILEVVEGAGSSRDSIVTTQLNWADGSQITQVTTQTDDDFWTGLTWTSDYAYLTMRNLYRVDLETAEGDWVWPFSEPIWLNE